MDEKPKLIFWSGPGGALLCSAPIGGMQFLDGDQAEYYGGKYFIGETIRPAMAKRIAEKFGGIYQEEKPDGK